MHHVCVCHQVRSLRSKSEAARQLGKNDEADALEAKVKPLTYRLICNRARRSRNRIMTSYMSLRAEARDKDAGGRSTLSRSINKAEAERRMVLAAGPHDFVNAKVAAMISGGKLQRRGGGPHVSEPAQNG